MKFAAMRSRAREWVARPESAKGVEVSGIRDHAHRKASGRATQFARRLR
jgi:hypothetical protein